MDRIKRIPGLLNALPEKEREKWITHILGSLVGAIEAAKVPRPLDKLRELME